MSTARKNYKHLIGGDIFGVRTKIKTQRKNPKNDRYSRRNRRR